MKISYRFIDKYTQVPRIINPIIITIQQIDKMIKNKGIKLYIDTVFGGTEPLKKMILVDFFRHAFDGSGADNFFDAGSCIDGNIFFPIYPFSSSLLFRYSFLQFDSK